MKNRLEIGDYDPKYGVFAGYLHKKEVWVGLKDEPEEMSWYEAMNWATENNKHIPSVDELTLAYLHKDEINSTLKVKGGEPFKTNNHYWSSSEVISGGSWALNMGSGFRGYGHNFNNYYLRSFQILEN